MSHDYLKWLIEDQAQTLLHMTGEQIAEVMELSRQTLAKYGFNYELLPVRSINLLIRHLETVKAAVLTTEAS